MYIANTWFGMYTRHKSQHEDQQSSLWCKRVAEQFTKNCCHIWCDVFSYGIIVIRFGLQYIVLLVWRRTFPFVRLTQRIWWRMCSVVFNRTCFDNAVSGSVYNSFALEMKQWVCPILPCFSFFITHGQLKVCLLQDIFESLSNHLAVGWS